MKAKVDVKSGVSFSIQNKKLIFITFSKTKVWSRKSILCT